MPRVSMLRLWLMIVLFLTMSAADAQGHPAGEEATAHATAPLEEQVVSPLHEESHTKEEKDQVSL